MDTISSVGSRSTRRKFPPTSHRKRKTTTPFERYNTKCSSDRRNKHSSDIKYNKFDGLQRRGTVKTSDS